MSTTIAEPKEATVPDGLHHRRGVEYLAAAAGMEPDKIGPAAVFGVEVGFSEATGFFKESKGRGYWMTSLNECSCPSFKFRGGPCKHQKRLAEELQKRAGPSLPAGVVPLSSEELDARRRRIEERNATRARAPAVEERPFRGFNCPEARAVVSLSTVPDGGHDPFRLTTLDPAPSGRGEVVDRSPSEWRPVPLLIFEGFVGGVRVRQRLELLSAGGEVMKATRGRDLSPLQVEAILNRLLQDYPEAVSRWCVGVMAEPPEEAGR